MRAAETIVGIKNTLLIYLLLVGPLRTDYEFVVFSADLEEFYCLCGGWKQNKTIQSALDQ